ncbi:hypothetical protein PoB_001754900 [Plakobranchus ocellatus]|uniref:Uncharacterized protein n=1 Tax=Plakobranchus ocellatus TaxID=259542 RepID=A0AAV3ZAS4_9GAST|nr:hypothetical protein PoB_001754900 [Plakobranchus ocellatus]
MQVANLLLDTFITAISRDLMTCQPKRIFSYLRTEEKRALAELRNSTDITIQLADKDPQGGQPREAIISGNGCPTEMTSMFVDDHPKDLVKDLPSYMKDDMDSVRKIQTLHGADPLPIDSLLCTLYWRMGGVRDVNLLQISFAGAFTSSLYCNTSLFFILRKYLAANARDGYRNTHDSTLCKSIIMETFE